MQPAASLSPEATKIVFKRICVGTCVSKTQVMPGPEAIPWLHTAAAKATRLGQQACAQRAAVPRISYLHGQTGSLMEC